MSRADPIYLIAVLSALVLLSEWLVRWTRLRYLGTALLVIILAAIVANLGVIPAGSTEAAPVPAYDFIFAHVAPVGIFWLLLQVNLREVLRAGLPLLALFLIGSAGTVAGVLLGMRAVGGAESIGPLYAAVAGMFAGTYIGGSVNFNAVALHYEVVRDGLLYGGSIVVDNIITTVWFVATLAAPRLLLPLWMRRAGGDEALPAAPIVDLAAETETVDPGAVAALLAVGAGAQALSLGLARVSSGAGFGVPPILIITTIALLLAQIPRMSRLRGARVAGMFAVYLFLAVIGAFCDVRALAGLGRLGLALLAFAGITVAMHGAIIFGAARALRLGLDEAAIASQANVGGSTSALALAKSLGREDLLLPAILLGSLGNAIGTFIGFLVVKLV